MKTCRLLTGLSVLVTSGAMALAPALPTKQMVTLEDGSEIEVQFKGSAYLNWHEDAFGNALMQQNGQWYYAEFAAVDGNFQLRPIQKLEAALDVAPQQSQLRPSAQALFNNPQNVEFAKPSRADFQALYSTVKPSPQNNAITTQPVLVVEVDFTNVKGRHDFQADVFSKEQRSVADFYDKNSLGQYQVIPAKETQGVENDGVISLSLNMRHPDCNPTQSSETCANAHKLAFAKAYQQLDQFIDFSQYDKNDDDYLHPTELSVLWVFAGGDLSTGGRYGPSTWPHQSYHPSAVVDGQTIEAYCVVGDTQANSKTTIGVIIHELGHLMLGLPDLYSYHDRGSLGVWGVMSLGSWGSAAGDTAAGQTPTNMSAFSKHSAGFVEPIILDSASHSVDLQNSEVGLVYLDPYLKEFGPKIYLENRVFEGYDRSLTAEGVLVTSVNVRNHFNANGPMQVQVLQADNQDDLGFYGGWSDDGDIYPGSQFNQEISDASGPSLSSITGFNTDVVLSQLSSSDAAASFIASIPDSDNKLAVQTSLTRSNTQYDRNVDTAVFEVTLDRDVELHGLYAYFSGGAGNYRLYKLPQADATFAPLVVDLNEAELLHEGRFARIGRTLFDPIELPAGTYNLMLQYVSRAVEVSQKWDRWGGEPERIRTWLGSSAQQSSTGLNPAAVFEHAPFAALFEYATYRIVEAYPDSVSTEQDTAVQLSPRSNDFVAPGYQFEVEIVTAPTNGVMTGLEYQPNPAFVGSDFIEYRLIETNGELVSNTARVYIQVVPAATNNQPPIANAVVESVALVAGKTVRLNGESSNDPEGANLNYLWTQTAGDTVELSTSNTGVTEFSLPANAKMGDQFEFVLMVVDSLGDSDQKTMVITVENSAPDVTDETIEVLLGELTTLNVLSNDRDQDGHQLTLSILGDVALGSATVVDGQIQYQAPTEQENGTQVRIDYEVTDEEGARSQGTATLVLKEESGEPATPNSGGSSGGSLGWLALLALGFVYRMRTSRD